MGSSTLATGELSVEKPDIRGVEIVRGSGTILGINELPCPLVSPEQGPVVDVAESGRIAVYGLPPDGCFITTLVSLMLQPRSHG